jgi:hypothetical protein
MNDYLMWQVARTRTAELRADACGARLAAALRRSRRGSGRPAGRTDGLWTSLAERVMGREAGEVCCA